LLCSGEENEEKLFNIKCREGISLEGLKRVGFGLLEITSWAEGFVRVVEDPWK
jgi:hypothetical protein